MKKLLIILLLLWPVTVCAGETQSIINSQLEQIDISGLEQQLEKVRNKDFGGIIPDFDMSAMIKSFTTGGRGWDISVILKRAFAFFCRELLISMKMMTVLIALALVCALAENLQRSFCRESGGVGDTAFLACFFLAAAVAVKAFVNAASAASGVLDDVTVFINALIPSMLMLLAAGGAVVSAGVFHQILMFSIGTISLAVKNILFPLVLISTALGVAGCVGEKNMLGRLSKLFGNAAKWTLGIMLTVFTGVISLQSIAVPAVDGISIKAVKFAVGAFVPIVGSVLSETMDMVFGSSVVVKNAVGITGLVSIIGICSVPLIRLAAQAAMFSLAAALTEPVADKRLTDMLSQIGSSLVFVFVLVLSVVVLFMISLAIVMSAGNSAAAFGR